MEARRLQELWDHHEIRQLLSTYCRTCDRADEVGMAATYCDDSWDDHGPKKMPGKPFSVATIQEAIETTSVVSHQLGQSLIEVDGDEAGAETYFIATLLRNSDDGGQIFNQLGGRYVDHLLRENGQWLIKRRLCVREWSVTNPQNGDWLAGAGFVETRRGQEDVSYAMLGIAHQGQLWHDASVVKHGQANQPGSRS